MRLLTFILNALWEEAGRIENRSSFHSFGPEYVKVFLKSSVFAFGICNFFYTGASFFRHSETRRYLWYLILCSILIHPSCLNRGSDGAMGSWSNINLAVLFCNLRMQFSPSFEQFPQTTQQ
jgi:hypothetical protein